MNWSFVISFLLSLIALCPLGAQEGNYSLEILSDQKLIEIKDLEEKVYADTSSINTTLVSLIHKLQDQLYFEASIDELSLEDSLVTASLHLGAKYEGFKISHSKGDRLEVFQNIERLKLYKEDLMQNLMNNGFPFAKICFQNLQMNARVLEGDLVLIKNEKILFNEIKIIGDAKLDQRFLSNFLNIKKGTPYNQALIDKIPEKLRQLNYVNVSGKPKMLFNKLGADVYLFLEKKKSSRFDLLFGLLPINDPLIDNTLIITSLGLIDLNNVFEHGENIYAKFEQLKPLTQELGLKFSWPFLLNTPFGLKSSGNLYKQDTSFIDLDYELGFRYFIGGNNFIEAYINNSATNVLQIKSAAIINAKSLPNILDRRNTAFGLRFHLNSLDYLYNPSSGFMLNTKLSLGNKRILENSDVVALKDPSDPEFSFASLYDELKQEQNQLEFEFEGAYYFKLGQSSTLKAGINVGGIFSNGEILTNEQFRLGGAKSLRGFNEQSFFVDQYYLGLLEYRLILSRNTYGFAFMDFAQLEDGSLLGTGSKRPLGFGAGFSFDTNTGIFNISVALGRDLLNPDDFFDLGQPKIHLGYISLF